MQLSILIPTLTERKHLLQRLIDRLTPQLYDEQGNKMAAIITYEDNREATTGHKRNQLVKACETPYASFIDDDDDVAMDYVPAILQGINQYQPDCITFLGKIISGQMMTEFEFRIKNPYDSKATKIGNRYVYRRPPNHLCAIRTEILRQYPFPDKTRFEDYEQCLTMAKEDALKTEYHINKTLYYYFYTKKQGDKSYGE